ncbi:YIP1 family protein [Actibacterium lipolyticum]|uniref:Yip1 domain protein n=1 Tax=Actibacterium lipolyticum TaxID=1524263 RepID=A0A238JVX3_9RHOB|nr:YIP1 family protein [Actibacterium lipolyticum]SMX34828.1 Yip1 domain protein [Actibacterium lipolyticum]
MAITTEILRSYRAPRAVLRRQLAGGAREDRALIYLFAACLIIFISTLPRLAREAHLAPEIPLDARVGGAMLGWIFIVPLAMYGLAALSHLIAKLFGGQGGWYGARLALFWALLAASPVWLFHGMVAGFIGQGAALTAVSAVLAVAFFYIWLSGLREAESVAENESTSKGS